GSLRFTTATRERLTDARVDLTIPFETWSPLGGIWTGLPAKFKFGPVYDFRDRDFSQRRFEYEVTSAAGSLARPPEIVLGPANLGQGVVGFMGGADPNDSFQAPQPGFGGYRLFALPLL